MSERINRLQKIATQLRRDVVNTVYYAGDGHPGPSLSITDILTVLYFDIMRINPEEPDWMQRDRFILSKGHACPMLYAALARRGYFPPAELKTLRSLGSRLQGHPVMHYTPGVDATSGSLGHGLPQGCGMALAARHRGDDNLVFVLTGDGEQNEGLVWEAAMSIAKFKLSNIIAMVDNNGVQSGGKVETIGGLVKLKEKWEAFGWYVVEIDGHKLEQIVSVLENAAKRGRTPVDFQQGMKISSEMKSPEPGQPVMIIAHTLKGSGIPFMEGNNAWHKRVPTYEEHQLAMSLLGGKDLE
jgi:transketolase